MNACVLILRQFCSQRERERGRNTHKKQFSENDMRNEKSDKSIYRVGAVKKDNIKHFKDVHRKYDMIPFM